MFDLIAGGYVYVAQPPLFRVKNKKQVYYVQTEEEMRTQLLEMGLSEAVFDAGNGRLIASDEMARMCKVLAGMEESIITLERRGISLRVHATRQDAQGRLPIYHVFIGAQEYWFSTAEERDA